MMITMCRIFASSGRIGPERDVAPFPGDDVALDESEHDVANAAVEAIASTSPTANTREAGCMVGASVEWRTTSTPPSLSD
jgi:hypothetical protein